MELRLAHADSAAHREPHQHGDSVIYLETRPLLSDADITFANPSIASSGELLLALGFSSEAGHRLASALQDHIGGQLAILLNGKVTNTVGIMSAVGAHGRLTLNTGVTGAARDRLRDAVHRRWPPT